MGENREKLSSVLKRLYESKKSIEGAIHTVESILNGNSADQSTELPKEPVTITSHTSVVFPAQIQSMSLGDMLTAKQLGMIKALGRYANVNVEFECLGLLKCDLNKLNKLSASAFIAHLQELQKMSSKTA